MSNYYRPQRSCGKVMFYTCVSFCSQGGADPPPRSKHPPPPSPTRTPRSACWEIGQQAGGTHPTGMHTCISVIFATPLDGHLPYTVKLIYILLLAAQRRVYCSNNNNHWQLGVLIKLPHRY